MKKSIITIELPIMLAVLLATYLVAGKYDIFERLVKFVNKYERYEIDETITVALVFLVYLLFFAFRLLRGERKSSRRLVEKNEQLKKANNEIEVLKGIVPICSICKDIRDDKGVWHKMEAYVQKRSQAKFSHSLCDKCLNEHYPEDED